MITGHTRLTGLFATPIRHSISPMMHNAAFKALDIDAVYLAFELGTERLPAAIESIRNLEMLGANLSMPNKIAALPLMDELSEAARLIGAVNTIVNDNGHLTGHNTDGIGFMRNLQDIGVNPVGEKMTLIGAGGAATAIITQAALDGVREIAVYNRKDGFFEKAADKLRQIESGTQCTITLNDLADEDKLAGDVSESMLLANATGAGMAPNVEAAAIENFDLIRPDLAVVDVIYNPRETKFLREAKERGAKTANGLGMLLYQGAAAFKLWTGEEMPIDIVKPIVENS